MKLELLKKKYKFLKKENIYLKNELEKVYKGRYYRFRAVIYKLIRVYPKRFVEFTFSIYVMLKNKYKKSKPKKFRLVFKKIKKNRDGIKILYDFQTFATQKYGGISRLFYELMNVYSRQKNIDFNLGLRYSENGYLKTSKYIKNSNTLIIKPKDEKEFSDFLPKLNFNGKYKLYSLLNHIGLYRYKLKYKIDHFGLFDPIKPYHYYRQYFSNVKRSLDLIIRKKFDVFHPTYFDTYFLKYIGKKPFVLTICDMIYEKYPEYFNKDDLIVKYKKKLVEKAARIMTISENTKKDIIDIYHIDPNKINVIPLASSLSSVDYKYIKIGNLPRKYLLYVGTRTVYKNFTLFIRTAASLLKKDKKLFIVATGNIVGAGEFTYKERKLFQKLKIAKRLLFIPVHSDNDLWMLYKNAAALVFPSLYEGFGLPILEAFSCGCPVVCSNTSSLPEVAGEAALYFNPRDKKSILDAVKKILSDKKLREELIKKGLERNKLFSWKKTASKIKNIYTEIIRENEK